MKLCSWYRGPCRGQPTWNRQASSAIWCPRLVLDKPPHRVTRRWITWMKRQAFPWHPCWNTTGQTTCMMDKPSLGMGDPLEIPQDRQYIGWTKPYYYQLNVCVVLCGTWFTILKHLTKDFAPHSVARTWSTYLYDGVSPKIIWTCDQGLDFHPSLNFPV